MFRLTSKIEFPHPNLADEDGLLAVGGDLSTKRLLLAYNQGIFPWFDENQPILWWSPNPRMVLFLEEFKASKSLRKIIDRNIFKITFNQDFSEVIRNCAKINRTDQDGTWITNEMEEAYINLHKQDHAISVEVWQNEKLVGGLYGIDLKEKKIFCGESMFARVSNASKVGLYFMVEYLKKKDYKFIDCQVYTDHLASLGAKEIERNLFLQYLNS